MEIIKIRAKDAKEIHRALIAELESFVPEDVKVDLREMSGIQADIESHLHYSKALNSEAVERYNELCYKHFPKMQDGGEFTKEEPKADTAVEKKTGGTPTVCDARALDLVHNYIIDHLDKSDSGPVLFDVFIVWKAKVLQNWKWLLSSTLPDGMYYELTYNGDKGEYYLDAYKKVENKVIHGGALA